MLDPNRRVLLWFGCEDIMYDVLLRRTYLRVMAQIWPGWTIHWATGGMADLADYVGHPRAAVLSKSCEPTTGRLSVADALRVDDFGYGDTAASIRFNATDVRVNRPGCECHRILYYGPAILPLVADANWPAAMSFDWVGNLPQIYPSNGVIDDRSPAGGFCVDVPAHAVDFWLDSPSQSADVQRRVQACWPGWTVTWHGDRFESQLDRAAGHLHFVLPDERDLMRRLRRTLLYPDQPWQPSSHPRLDVRTRLFDAAIAAAHTR